MGHNRLRHVMSQSSRYAGSACVAALTGTPSNSNRPSQRQSAPKTWHPNPIRRAMTPSSRPQMMAEDVRLASQPLGGLSSVAQIRVRKYGGECGIRTRGGGFALDEHRRSNT
jgi:hypothetical protein